jgi:hypothetical protein
MPSEILCDAYGLKITQGNQGIYTDIVQYIGIGDRTPSLVQYMEHLAMIDMSLNMSPPASASNMNMNTKTSARKMESKNGGTMGTTGMAKDNSLTYYNCGQAGHISCNCLNCLLIEKVPEQVLVNKDVMKTKNSHQGNVKKYGGIPTGRNRCGWLAKGKVVQQGTDGKAECESESLSDSDSEVGKGKRG